MLIREWNVKIVLFIDMIPAIGVAFWYENICINIACPVTLPPGKNKSAPPFTLKRFAVVSAVTVVENDLAKGLPQKSPSMPASIILGRLLLTLSIVSGVVRVSAIMFFSSVTV